MTKAVEVITSVERRRRWSMADKERIVAAAMEPGAVASEVARAAGIYPSQLFRWRQQLCKRTQVPAAFSPVTIAPSPIAIAPEPGVASPAGTDKAGTIEVEFATGGRMRIIGPIEASVVSELIGALGKRRRR